MTRIDMAWYDAHPFFYLVDGWEFYRMPYPLGNLRAGAGRPPLFGPLRRLRLGDPSANPHGCATYRTVLETDEIQRDYALN